MSTPAFNRSLVVLTLASLSACGSGPGGDDASVACVGSLAGGGTQVTAAPCATCTVTNAPHAIDGVAETFAAIDFNNADPVTHQHPGGAAALRATAQSGIVFPAGSRAGALLTVARGADSTLTIQTYLGTQPQEAASMPVSPRDGALQVFETSLPFDGVELQLADFSASNGAEFRVYEFCGGI